MQLLHLIVEKFGTAVDWIVGLMLELVEELRGIITEDHPSHPDSPSAYREYNPAIDLVHTFRMSVDFHYN